MNNDQSLQHWGCRAEDGEVGLLLAVLICFPCHSLQCADRIDLVGFSFSWELDYKNILTMLERMGVPISAHDRTMQHPLVRIKQGPSAMLPHASNHCSSSSCYLVATGTP